MRMMGRPIEHGAGDAEIVMLPESAALRAQKDFLPGRGDDAKTSPTHKAGSI